MKTRVGVIFGGRSGEHEPPMEKVVEPLVTESVSILTDRDRDTILQLLDLNVGPNEGLKEAAQIHRQLIIQ